MNIETIAASYLHKMLFGRAVRKPATDFPNIVHSVTKTFTLAEITAAHVTPAELLPDLKNLKVRPVALNIVASGTFDAFTSFVIQTNATSPVAIATVPLASINTGLVQIGLNTVTPTASAAIPATLSNSGMTNDALAICNRLNDLITALGAAGTVVRSIASTNQGVGAGFLAAGSIGKGLKVKTTGGSAASTGTSVTVQVFYEIVEA
jgi:hypothetical protein